MPTYQYRCTECGHDLEAVQKFSDASLTECPNCAGQLRKVFNAVGVVFKGSGFYRTDSRAKVSENGSAEKSGAKSESGSQESGGSAPGKTDGAKSDSGSETKKADSGKSSSDSGSSSGDSGAKTAGKQPAGSGSSTG